MDFTKIFLVGFGGFVGSVARYLCVKGIDEKFVTSFPNGTLIVNIAGSFLLGLIYAFTSRLSMPDHYRLLLGTGFCGGFTTFSAFALENFNLIEQRMAMGSILYIALSVVAGLFAVWAGIVLGKAIG